MAAAVPALGSGMTSLAIIGGTGYSGGNIAAEAAGRGFDVTVVARHEPDSLPSGATFVRGAVDDADLVSKLAAEHDLLVVAIHAVDADAQPVLAPALPALAAAAVAGGARLGVVGGAGSSLVAPGGPRVVDTPEFPEMFKPEALAHAGVLDWLRSDAVPAGLEWFYVSPAGEYGSYAPGETTGSYRTDDDLLVVNADGTSEISGTDYALAFVDEIATPKHRNARFTTGH